MHPCLLLLAIEEWLPLRALGKAKVGELPRKLSYVALNTFRNLYNFSSFILHPSEPGRRNVFEYVTVAFKVARITASTYQRFPP
jgi:hypothetical protein